MSNTHKQRCGSQEPVRRDDLVNLVVKPLSARIDQVWVHLSEKLQGIEAALDIIARQTARELQQDRED
ncbi:MAG TPA: hypothetical protein VMV72_04925 [Verrucomicrobiae bacterium]|nr:hypothetical protein [Verrucomicrobiae bacterium]